jgi:hypothetical protein
VSVNQRGSADEKVRALGKKERDGVEGRRGKEGKSKAVSHGKERTGVAREVESGNRRKKKKLKWNGWYR